MARSVRMRVRSVRKISDSASGASLAVAPPGTRHRTETAALRARAGLRQKLVVTAQARRQAWSHS